MLVFPQVKAWMVRTSLLLSSKILRTALPLQAGCEIRLLPKLPFLRFSKATAKARDLS